MEKNEFYVGSRGQDIDFSIKDISYDKEENCVDVSLNHLYLSFHKDNALELAEGILQALKEAK